MDSIPASSRMPFAMWASAVDRKVETITRSGDFIVMWPRPFDRDTTVTHPTLVIGLTRRVAAVAAVLTLSVGNPAVCGGWQPTPEARMACCTTGASCPMHAQESQSPATDRDISQVQADSCCAASSDGTQSSNAGAGFVPSNLAPVTSAAPLVVPPPVLALQQWRTVVPLPDSPVPKHLLFSVLLV